MSVKMARPKRGWRYYSRFTSAVADQGTSDERVRDLLSTYLRRLGADRICSRGDSDDRCWQHG